VQPAKQAHTTAHAHLQPPPGACMKELRACSVLYCSIKLQACGVTRLMSDLSAGDVRAAVADANVNPLQLRKFFCAAEALMFSSSLLTC